jgi:cyclophilin family peptidyl-prolyl cis-trans isomerase
MSARQTLVGFCALVAAVGLAGCGKAPDPAAGQPVGGGPAVASAPADDPGRFTRSFEDATTTRAPAGTTLPPARTLAGVPTVTLYEAIKAAWPGVSVTDPAGRPVPVVVALDTDLGPVEIELFPDQAPNHVRNFLALSKVGFYNGLVFERVIRNELIATDPTGGEQPLTVEYVTAGCPAGDGEPDHGHLAYFLRPEPNALRHEEGTVGFLRTADEAESASCRIYVCLGPAPVLDSRFTPMGKVTRGMDVIKAIASRPVKDRTSHPEDEQPREPVKIKAVTRR